MSHKKARIPHALIQAKINDGIQGKISHALSQQALEYERVIEEKELDYKLLKQNKAAEICNLTHSLDDVQSSLIIAQNQAQADAKKAQETEHKLRRTIQHLEQKIQNQSTEQRKAEQQEVEHFFASMAPATPSFLVDNWRDSWKWISTQCFALIMFFATVPIPAEVLAVLPENIRTYLIAFTAFCGLVGRYLNQSGGFKDGGFTGRS